MISIKAKIIEKVIGLIGIRNVVTKMMLDPKRNDKYEKPPKKFYKKYDIKCHTINNHKCITMKASDDPKKHILYFHGGAYTIQAKKMHWHLVKCMLREKHFKITFINYPLAPEFTCTDTIDMVSKAYSFLCKTNEQEIILMGDSAGGGLALALAQYTKTEGIQPKPTKIILLSPWLDISMENEISKEQEENDLILNRETLKTVGKTYAGDLDTKNYLCSPLYGDMINIGEILILTGTSEILNVQAKLLRDRSISNGCDLSYYEYEQMQHVWIGFPILEAKDAMDKVISFIRK